MKDYEQSKDKKVKCEVCGIYVNNMRRHKARDRCNAVSIRREDR